MDATATADAQGTTADDTAKGVPGPDSLQSPHDHPDEIVRDPRRPARTVRGRR